MGSSLTISARYHSRPPMGQPASVGSSRLVSVDAVRGLALLALLVLPHAGTAEALAPAFLFVMGVAVPFALERRRREGATAGEQAQHVAARVLALAVTGIFVANGRRLDPAASGVPYAIWNAAALGALLVLWTPHRVARRPAVRLAAVAILLALAVVYRSTYGTRLGVGDRGLLGEIAGAYAVAAGLYGCTGRTRLGPLAAFAAVLAWHVGTHFDFTPLPIIGNGGAASVALAGVVAGHWLRYDRNAAAGAGGLLVLAAALGAAGAGLPLLVAPAALALALAVAHASVDDGGRDAWVRPLTWIGRRALIAGLAGELLRRLVGV